MPSTKDLTAEEMRVAYVEDLKTESAAELVFASNKADAYLRVTGDPVYREEKELIRAELERRAMRETCADCEVETDRDVMTEVYNSEDIRDGSSHYLCPGCSRAEFGVAAPSGGERLVSETIDDLGRAEIRTRDVLEDIADERRRQRARYGTNYDLADGTGPGVVWLWPFTGQHAAHIEEYLRGDYESFEEETGKPTWLHLVREEVAEAFKESDPARLREELLQVAALAVSWVEKLDAVGPTP